MSAYLLLLCFSLVDGPLLAQGVATGGNAFYRPPILPIEFGVNTDGELSAKFTTECVTPLGTVGIGAGVSSIKSKHSTYFIVRQRNQEQVFAVGVPGKIRLRTEGKSEVDISRAAKFDNAFVIDVRSVVGKFEVEFVPDPAANELARIHFGPFDHLVLRADGALVLDRSTDDVIPQSSLEEVYVALTGGGFSHFTYFYVEGGKKKYSAWPLDPNATLEAKWFTYCLRKISPKIAPEISVVGEFSGGDSVVFSDGGLNNQLTFLPGRIITGSDISPTDSTQVLVYLDRSYGRSFPQLTLRLKSTENATKFRDTLQRQLEKRQASSAN